MAELSPVGMIGLGLMGEAFSGLLRKAGFAVVGNDIDPAKAARLRALGGRWADSAADVARDCPLIVLIVFNTDQVEQVLEREILPAVGENSGRIVLCASTCDPDRVAALGARVAARGIRLLETPVSGTSEQVRKHEGVGLIGGDPALMAEAKPVLDAIYARHFHIGAIGDGGRAKLAINLILGVNRAALAEGLVFAERLGLDPARFLAVARASAAYSQVMDTKGDKMVRGDFAPQGMVQVTHKDASLMLEQAAKAGQQLPLLAVHHDLLAGCIRNGQGLLDNSAVIEEVRRRR